MSIAKWEAGDTAEEIAFCLTIKDEYHDLTEWLVHHYNHHNIRRFYIMDDGSSPPDEQLRLQVYIFPMGYA